MTVGKSHVIEVQNYVNGRFVEAYRMRNGNGTWRPTTRFEIDEYLDKHYHVIWNPGKVGQITFIGQGS